MEGEKLNGNPLRDEELDMVAGGSWGETSEVFCPNCQRITPAIYSDTRSVYDCRCSGVSHRITGVIPIGIGHRN